MRFSDDGRSVSSITAVGRAGADGLRTGTDRWASLTTAQIIVGWVLFDKSRRRSFRVQGAVREATGR
jgi:hypothetical protein